MKKATIYKKVLQDGEVWWAITSQKEEGYLEVLLKGETPTKSIITLSDALRTGWEAQHPKRLVASSDKHYSDSFYKQTEELDDAIWDISNKPPDKFEGLLPKEQQTSALREKLKEGEDSGFVDGDLWYTIPNETPIQKAMRKRYSCDTPRHTFNSTEEAEIMANLENQRDSAWDTLSKMEALLEKWKEKA